MERVAFVMYADRHYVKIQEPLIRSIRKFYPKATVFAFRSFTEIHPDCPSHSDNPYAFKMYAIEHARFRGYDIVIWLDSPNRLVKPIEEWLSQISSVGVYLQRDGWWCGQWVNDNCLKYFGITRDEAMTIPNIYASIMAFDFRNPIASEFLSRWKKACFDGAFRGKAKNDTKSESQDPRCLGHRHDQSCAELIAYQMGIEPQPMVLGENLHFLSWVDV
jgi:hypothetical protein